MNPGIPGRLEYGLLLTMLAVASAACGDSAREEVDRERRTAGLVVGSAAAEWSLLTVPRTGGTADLRALVDPDSIAWNGRTELPVARDVRAVGSGAIVLLAEDGRLLRYDPVADQVTELATLSADARFVGESDDAVAFVDSGGRRVLEADAQRSVEYSLQEPAVWAAPVEAGIATLDEEGTLRLVPRADADSAQSPAIVEVEGAGSPPGLVTAWGRRIALAAPSGGALRIYSVGDGIELVGEAELGGPIRSLAVSPSSHEIYVAHGDPPRVSRVSRFDLDTDVLAEPPAPVTDLRTGLFGGALLARADVGTLRLRVGHDEWTRMPGEWRSDLPIGLPGDLSILLVDDEARLTSPVDSAGVALAGGSPRWWLPVRYTPTATVEEDLREALDELGAEAGAPGETDAEDEGRADTEADAEADMPQIGEEAAAAQEGPPGYYAIVASARRREGVESLLASLEEAGYPTRIQTFPDEAGEEWNRGLVGPFPSRARAQAAARQLLRERGLQAWVTEITGTE